MYAESVKLTRSPLRVSKVVHVEANSTMLIKQTAEQARDKLASMSITEDDIEDAIEWARKNPGRYDVRLTYPT